MRELLLNLPDELLDEIAERMAAVLPQNDAREESWRLLGLDEAATRLGRSTRWVRDRVKAGDLPYIRLDGGALAFELADLQAFVWARRVAAEEPESLAGRLQAAHKPASANGFNNGHRVDNRKVSG
jgi:Helix-turn-helix domain